MFVGLLLYVIMFCYLCSPVCYLWDFGGWHAAVKEWMVSCVFTLSPRLTPKPQLRWRIWKSYHHYVYKLLCEIYTQCWKPWICMVRIKNTWMAGSATTQSRRYSKPALLHLSFRVSSKSLRLAVLLVSLCFCPPQKNLHFDNFFQCHCTSSPRWACPNMARNDFQNLEKLCPPI